METSTGHIIDLEGLGFGLVRVRVRVRVWVRKLQILSCESFNLCPNNDVCNAAQP